MELLASPSLFFAFLAGTAFGDLLAGRFPLSFVSPRGELMSSGRPCFTKGCFSCVGGPRVEVLKQNITSSSFGSHRALLHLILY